MTLQPRRRRGQPLAALVLIVTGWAIVRLASWDDPFSIPPPPPLAFAPELANAPALPASQRMLLPPARPEARLTRAAGRSAAAAPPIAAAGRPTRASPPPSQRVAAGGPYRGPSRLVALTSSRPGSPPDTGPAATTPAIVAAPAGARPAPEALSGLTALPVVQPPAPPLTRMALTRMARTRWSGDGWVLWRAGSSGVAAAGQASYGGSQAGTVLRYAFAPGSAHQPAAYVRLSRALASAESEAALGLSARPLARVAVRLLAEGRVQRSNGTTRLRPAASLVSEFRAQQLPLGFAGEAFAQAGYVAGATATPFFDVQATVTRPLVQTAWTGLSLGAGAWAGGQQGAARFDVGPRAGLWLNVAGAPARLALDWRFRVAGEAEPSSGPAATFSAGF